MYKAALHQSRTAMLDDEHELVSVVDVVSLVLILVVSIRVVLALAIDLHFRKSWMLSHRFHLVVPPVASYAGNERCGSWIQSCRKNAG